MKLLARIFGVDRVHIAIEQNKANAAGMLNSLAAKARMALVPLPMGADMSNWA